MEDSCLVDWAEDCKVEGELVGVASAAGVTTVYIVVVWYNTPGSEIKADALVAGLLSLDWLLTAGELGTGVLVVTTIGGVIGVSGAGVDWEELVAALLCVDGVWGE